MFDQNGFAISGKDGHEDFHGLLQGKKRGLKEKQIVFCKVDLDDNDAFSEKCEIKSVPTFIIMKEKKILGTVNGSDINKVGELIKNCCKDL